MKKPELLAPAGDLHRAKTAIRYGADAVYLGGQSFSLRSRASNFSLEDIKEACAFARRYDAHIHVTVNIIPHEEDFTGLEEYLKKLEEYGVTAIIAASPYIMETARRAAPKLQIHCSTQMSVTNAAAIQFLKEKLDIDRAVLGRECTMAQVTAITAHSPVETEAFIHGGMCVNYSGRCTLSNRMTLRDANRGGCAQSCRWSYHVYEGEAETAHDTLFTMGSRDLCAAEYMEQLMEAGVSSLKIEGRMKTEYYVACIVSAYRHLIDEIAETGGPLSPERMAVHEKEILRGENRETCSGFYSGDAGLETLIYHANSNADVNHDFLGTVKQITAHGTCIIETRNVFACRETLEFLTPGEENRRFVLEQMKNVKSGEEIDEIRSPMTLVEIPVPFAVQENDILRRYR
jgi:putative protease